MMVPFLLTILCVINGFTEGAKILGVFPVPSISHQFIFQPIWKELALRGHEVTVISPNILGEDIKNLKEIDVGFVRPMMPNITEDFSKGGSFLSLLTVSQKWSEDLLEAEIRCQQVQDMLNDENTHFDLVLVEYYNPLILGFGSRFKAPVVAIVSVNMGLTLHYAIGNPVHLALTPDYFNYNNLNPSESTIWDRLNSVFYNIIHRAVYYWYLLPKTEEKLRQHFGNDLPSIRELETNISLALTTSNPLMNPVAPSVPSVIEISQLHVKPKKPLPQDIKHFLDKSTEGVVYFSLGSNVQSANLTSDVKNIIISALSELPYKVLWKWETDHLPNQPKNVMIKKWLPQQDVLGHPNIKAFVTQGGLQSVEEAISNGVPMIGIPFMADQPVNILRMVKLGVAKILNYKTMTKDELKNCILEVAGNKTYKQTISNMQEIITDTPMTGLEKAVWWIEYVIRHKGAKHLRSPLLDVPFYKYYLLDVLAVILTPIFVFLIVVVLMISRSMVGRKVEKYKTS